MGYILPITHFQYQDYQNRVIKSDQDPFYIEHPYKVTLDTKSREMEDREDVLKNGGSSKNNSHYEPMHVEEPKSEKLYEKLTGKGQHFSGSI
ncbi:hypothetical protein [Virgibacillus necropolis]|uniref:Uncharacterized protein n=1 Tax=Virgibacillus necropolis TaxID=163877 RepID=A0A221MFT4_9BACI|nr:hypothetical protein [Virgibacillus necropolis]ASN06494.1 hypothetical protein CFK40_16460 [Virgibacillus necropolis]